MRSNLPTYLSIAGSWGASLVQYFYFRTYPNPNQAGSPGSLPNLTGATFTASLLDMFDGPVAAVPDLAVYLVGSTGGTVTLTIPQAVVEEIPAGTYRYRIAMSGGGQSLVPTWQGPFQITGTAPQVEIAPPGPPVPPSPPVPPETSSYLIWSSSYLVWVSSGDPSYLVWGS